MFYWAAEHRHYCPVSILNMYVSLDVQVPYLRASTSYCWRNSIFACIQSVSKKKTFWRAFRDNHSGNHCTKQEATLSKKNTKGISICVTCRKTDFKYMWYWFLVVAMICNLRCNLHTIGSNFAKYEHPLSKNERAVPVTSYKIRF